MKIIQNFENFWERFLSKKNTKYDKRLHKYGGGGLNQYCDTKNTDTSIGVNLQFQKFPNFKVPEHNSTGLKSISGTLFNFL